MKKKYEGLHAHRYAREPDEKKFAEEWALQNEQHQTLAYLLGDGSKRVEPTAHDHRVAATVVQWLGSPVGQAFLRVCGFEKVGPDGYQKGCICSSDAQCPVHTR